MKVVIAVFLLSMIINAQDWKEYSIEHGDFFIQFPEQPAERTQDITTSAGILKFKLLLLDKVSYGLLCGFVDYPENFFNNVNIDSFFTGYTNGLLGSTGGELHSQTNIKFDNYPGTDIILGMGEGNIVRMKVYLVQNRAYSLSYYVSSEGIDDEINQKFFDSFRITEDAGKTVVEKMLNEIGYGFHKNEHNEYEITLEYPNQRTQLLTISPIIAGLDSTARYDIWTRIAKYDTINPEICHKMFLKNAETEFGRFQSFELEEGFMLIYSNIYNGELNNEILKTLLYDIGIIADEFEEEITKEDEY